MSRTSLSSFPRSEARPNLGRSAEPRPLSFDEALVCFLGGLLIFGGSYLLLVVVLAVAR